MDVLFVGFATEIPQPPLNGHQKTRISDIIRSVKKQFAELAQDCEDQMNDSKNRDDQEKGCYSSGSDCD
jgi:hypothetical protein